MFHNIILNKGLQNNISFEILFAIYVLSPFVVNHRNQLIIVRDVVQIKMCILYSLKTC